MEYEPPLGELEEAVALVWKDALQLERVGRNWNFFELGGNSVCALDVLFKINQQFGAALTVAEAYMNPTIRELAGALGGNLTVDSFVDLSQEAVLDERIKPLPARPSTLANNLLLTGGTGFVGRFLLAQLLHDTDATLHCLVRPGSDRTPVSRLQETLQKWGLWRDDFTHRIVSIPGDLRLPRLGITDRTYRELCEKIDIIYHCGTSMNHLETYEMARAANVESVGELLKLATHTKPKLTNYVSTLGVFGASETGVQRSVDEATSIDDEKHRESHGYSASKWVGEKLFVLARDRGIPCNIFRLGFIWADTHRGRYDELQHAHRLIKSCLLCGLGIRALRYETPPTPVDYTARAIAFLGNRHSNGGAVFHISSLRESSGDIFERCNEILGTSLELVPFYDWVQEIKRLHYAGRSLPVVPVIEYAFAQDEGEFYEQQRRIRSGTPHFDSTRTQRELEPAGIVAPPLTDALLRLCLERMIADEPELLHLTSRRAVAR